MNVCGTNKRVKPHFVQMINILSCIFADLKFDTFIALGVFFIDYLK